METVSESFKNAIKSDTREIKGYVEVIYNEKDMSNYIVTTSFPLERISIPDNLLGSTKKIKNYASLEENYTLLDGGFILPNYNIIGDNAGLISKNTFENIEDATLNITNSSDQNILSSGITIYFENNVSQDFDIIFTFEDNNTLIIPIKNNTKNIYQNIFEEEITIKSLEIKINKIEHPNRRLRIANIDFGVSQIYEGNDLVSFTVNEELDLLLASAPINDCKINLSNYENIFNPLNPTGLVKYLTDDCIIKPYIGALTEENGIEYVSMGYFYLKDWSNDTNGNTTLNGQSLMAKLVNLTLISDGTFLYHNGTNWTNTDLNKYLKKIYGYDFQLSFGNIGNLHLRHTELLKYLQTIFSYMVGEKYQRKFSISRNNRVVFDSINLETIDTITKKELKEDVKYESKTILNKVKIKDIDNYNMTSTIQEDVLNQAYTLTSNEEYVWFKFNKRIARNNNNQSFSYSGNGNAELIDYNNWLAYIKFAGNVGDVITVHLNAFVFDTPPILEKTISNNKQTGDTLSLDFTEYFNASNNWLQDTANYYLNIDKKYKVTGNYNGDPSFVPGDSISVETKFGYKDVIMTKHSLTFDSGLSGSFEGMGD